MTLKTDNKRCKDVSEDNSKTLERIVIALESIRQELKRHNDREAGIPHIVTTVGLSQAFNESQNL